MTPIKVHASKPARCYFSLLAKAARAPLEIEFRAPHGHHSHRARTGGFLKAGMPPAGRRLDGSGPPRRAPRSSSRWRVLAACAAFLALLPTGARANADDESQPDSPSGSSSSHGHASSSVDDVTVEEFALDGPESVQDHVNVAMKEARTRPDYDAAVNPILEGGWVRARAVAAATARGDIRPPVSSTRLLGIGAASAEEGDDAWGGTARLSAGGGGDDGAAPTPSPAEIEVDAETSSSITSESSSQTRKKKKQLDARRRGAGGTCSEACSSIQTTTTMGPTPMTPTPPDPSCEETHSCRRHPSPRLTGCAEPETAAIPSPPAPSPPPVAYPRTYASGPPSRTRTRPSSR